MSTNIHRELGEAVGAAMLGMSCSELRAAKGCNSVMSSAEAIPFNRELCKIAAAAYAAAGEKNSPACVLFEKLACTDDWFEQYNEFTDSVKRALAKQAMLPLTGASPEGVGGPFRSLVATGVLGGAGLGSLAFLLSRNAAQSSAENAELLEKVRAFKQLKQEIEEDMKANDVLSKATGGKDRYDV